MYSPAAGMMLHQSIIQCAVRSWCPDEKCEREPQKSDLFLDQPVEMLINAVDVTVFTRPLKELQLVSGG